MSFLRKLTGGGREPPPETAPAATNEAWEPGEFARASGKRIEVRFHDSAAARLATGQLRELKREWQDQKHGLAAAKAEQIAEHAVIVNGMTARQARIDALISRIDGAIAQVDAYARRNP